MKTMKITKEKVIEALLCELRKPEADLIVFNSGDFRIKIKDLKIYFNTGIVKRTIITKVFFNLFNAEKSESYLASNLLVESVDYKEHFYLLEEERQNILSVLKELKSTAQSKVEQILDETINNCNGNKN